MEASNALKKILLVENCKSISNVFALILQKNGFTTDIAESTAESLQKICTCQYDEILIDEDPPNVSSKIILQKLANNKTIKIVITDYPEQARLNGADACLEKIVRPIELILITQKLLKSNRP
jgi:DNA-binding response OmpR family regulator